MKDKKQKEPIVINKQPTLKTEEKAELAAKLILCNIELAQQNIRSAKARSLAKKNNLTELTSVKDDLEITKEDLRGRIQWLRKIMHLTTHNVRQPIASILGLSALLEETDISVREERIIINYIKQSVKKLDSFTKEPIRIITLATGSPPLK
jgi:F0F1-type ATP synthase beta subunit